MKLPAALRPFRSFGDATSFDDLLADPAILPTPETNSAAPTPPCAPIAAAQPGLVNPVASTGDRAMLGDTARSLYTVSGAGVKVGILSDSFNMRGGYAADTATGALASGVQIIQDGPANGADEGRAMAELVHKVAPSASLAFYTAFRGEADFANGIKALAAAGCKVIVDDVTYLSEPFFQAGGVIQQAIEKARQEKKIGSNLEATVALTLPAEGFDHPVFNDPATLHEFLILSDLQITRGGDLSAVVQESTHCKCGRCWKYRPDVGANAEHPTLCGRCVEAVG